VGSCHFVRPSVFSGHATGGAGIKNEVLFTWHLFALHIPGIYLRISDLEISASVRLAQFSDFYFFIDRQLNFDFSQVSTSPLNGQHSFFIKIEEFFF
jgi:hypothetical protein